MVFLASAYFTLALLVSSCSNAMEIIPIAARNPHTSASSWNSLPLEIQKCIVQLIGDETHELDDTLRLINKRINSFVPNILEKRKQVLMHSLLQCHDKVDVGFNFNIVHFDTTYSSSTGYNKSKIDLNNHGINGESKEQLLLNNISWNKYATACCGENNSHTF